jgi:glutamate/tyrosine decarboxylase-like PLP-dependent enzyme
MQVNKDNLQSILRTTIFLASELAAELDEKNVLELLVKAQASLQGRTFNSTYNRVGTGHTKRTRTDE